MKLPGLNFNPSGYDDANIIGGEMAGRYKKIPFADWLPPDFEDVPCSRGAGLKMMYFSAGTGMMVAAESETGCEAIHPSELDYWLKKVS